jgi:hypothetical protein
MTQQLYSINGVMDPWKAQFMLNYIMNRMWDLRLAVEDIKLLSSGYQVFEIQDCNTKVSYGGELGGTILIEGEDEKVKKRKRKLEVALGGLELIPL